MSAPPTDGHPPPPTFDILAAPSPAPEPAPTRDGYLRIVRGWQNGMAELSPAHLAALEGELTDEAAMIRGATTSAADVLDESLNALVRLDVVAVVSAHARAMHFGKMRVRYIFDKVDELYGVVQAQLAQGSAWSVAQAKLERVTDDGRAVRNSLLQGFERLVRRFPSLETDVLEARGNSKNPPTVSASLDALATLLESWLHDPKFAPRLETVAFGADDVREARAAMETIEAQRIVASQSPAAPRDLPATNVIEGRLMHELHELYRALEEGRVAVPTLPQMVLGNTLRRVFAQIRGTPLPAQPDPAAEPKPEPSPSPQSPDKPA